MVSRAVRHSMLAVLKIGAMSPRSRGKLTKGRASFSHPHRALATQLGLTANLEWQLEVNVELSLHDFFRCWLQLLRLPKATRSQPDSITTCWLSLSLTSIYQLEPLSLPPCCFSRPTTAQGSALTRDPKQAVIGPAHLPLQFSSVGHSFSQVNICFIETAAWSCIGFPHCAHEGKIKWLLGSSFQPWSLLGFAFFFLSYHLFCFWNSLENDTDSSSYSCCSGAQSALLIPAASDNTSHCLLYISLTAW